MPENKIEKLIKQLRIAAEQAKSAASLYDREIISASEFCRLAVGFHALTDTPDQILLLLDELDKRGAQIAALTADNWNMRDVLRQLINGRPGGCYFIRWEPLILKALNETPVTDAAVHELREGKCASAE